MAGRWPAILSALSSILPLAVSSIAYLLPGASIAAGQIPGEEQIGVFRTITHLHPAAYVILLFVFFLSVLNLIYQGWLSQGAWSLAGALALRRSLTGKGLVKRPDAAPSSAVGEKSRVRVGPRTQHDQASEEADAGGVVGKPRVVTRAGRTRVSQPTPLEGVNHPLPSFSPSEGRSPAEETTIETRQGPKTPAPHQFKFTSAVDLLSPEEIEKRDKEKFVVTGTVSGPDGKGIPSVIVYLADEEGKRLGQSYLSTPETGEFKVLTNKPGRYVLHGYKRGYIMDPAKPGVLPMQSGKIEGYSLRMIPEGCIVHGKVTFEEEVVPSSALAVKCVVEGSSFSGFGRVGQSGSFMLHGVPLESRCHLEVRARDGEVLAISDPFETRQERHVTQNVTIKGSGNKPRESQEDPGHPASWNDPPAGSTSPPDSASADPLSSA